MFSSKPATASNNQSAQAEARKVSLIAGIFFLLTFIHVGILPLYDDVLNNTDFILGVGNATSVQAGAFIEVITIIANVATGVILFQVLRRQHLGLALGYVAVRIFESTIIAVGTICILAIVTLREGAGEAAGVDAATLTAIGSALVAVRDWTFFFGPGLCAGLGNGLLLGFLMYKSGLVPRNMALLGVVGGPLSLVGLTGVLFGQWEQTGETQFLFTLGEIAWELSLSIYLIVKGFRPSPILADEVSDEVEQAPSRGATQALPATV